MADKQTSGLGGRLKAKLDTRRKRSAERALARKEHKIESNAQRATGSAKNYGGTGNLGGGG